MARNTSHWRAKPSAAQPQAPRQNRQAENGLFVALCIRQRSQRRSQQRHCQSSRRGGVTPESQILRIVQSRIRSDAVEVNGQKRGGKQYEGRIAHIIQNPVFSALVNLNFMSSLSSFQGIRDSKFQRNISSKGALPARYASYSPIRRSARVSPCSYSVKSFAVLSAQRGSAAVRTTMP